MPTIKLLPHQDDFVFSTDKYPAIIGGLGSGKTRAGTIRLIKLMMEDKEIDTLYLMPTYDLIRLRAITGVIEDLEAVGLKYTLNKSTSTIQVHGHGNILFRSYDRPEKIIAFEVAHAIVDEIDTLNKDKAEEVWRKVTERIRQTSKVPNSIACVTTPDSGVSGFVYDRWVKNKAAGYKIIKASTYDNPFLPEDYTQQILNNYDEILADLYLRGEFVSLNQNKVYWAYDRIKHHSDRVVTDKDKVIYYGQDFNVGGNVTIVFVIDNNIPIAVDEILSVTTQDTVQKINAKYPNKTIVAFPDSSGGNESANAPASSIALLKQGGHRVDAPSKNPFVRDRINAVNGLFSHNRLFINSNTCEQLAFSLEAQGYDEKNRPEKYNSHPAIDDYCDALGYFIHRKFAIKRPTLVSGRRR